MEISEDVCKDCANVNLAFCDAEFKFNRCTYCHLWFEQAVELAFGLVDDVCICCWDLESGEANAYTNFVVKHGDHQFCKRLAFIDVCVDLDVRILCKVCFIELEINFCILECYCKDFVDVVAVEDYLYKCRSNADYFNKCLDVSCKFFTEERECNAGFFFCFFTFCGFCFVAFCIFTTKDACEESINCFSVFFNDAIDCFCINIYARHIKTCEVNKDSAINHVDAEDCVCLTIWCAVNDNWCIDVWQECKDIKWIKVLCCCHDYIDHINDAHVFSDFLCAFKALFSEIVHKLSKLNFKCDCCFNACDFAFSCYDLNNCLQIFVCKVRKEPFDECGQVNFLILCKCQWEINLFCDCNSFNLCHFCITCKVWCFKDWCVCCCKWVVNILNCQCKADVCVIDWQINIGVECEFIIICCFNLQACKDFCLDIFIDVKTTKEHIYHCKDELVADCNWELMVADNHKCICCCICCFCFIFLCFAIEQAIDCVVDKLWNNGCCNAQLGNICARCIDVECVFCVVCAEPEVDCAKICDVVKLNWEFAVCRIAEVNKHCNIHAEVCRCDALWAIYCRNFKFKTLEISEDVCKDCADVNLAFCDAKFKFNRCTYCHLWIIEHCQTFGFCDVISTDCTLIIDSAFSLCAICKDVSVTIFVLSVEGACWNFFVACDTNLCKVDLYEDFSVRRHKVDHLTVCKVNSCIDACCGNMIAVCIDNVEWCAVDFVVFTTIVVITEVVEVVVNDINTINCIDNVILDNPLCLVTAHVCVHELGNNIVFVLCWLVCKLIVEAQNIKFGESNVDAYLIVPEINHHWSQRLVAWQCVGNEHICFCNCYETVICLDIVHEAIASLFCICFFSLGCIFKRFKVFACWCDNLDVCIVCSDWVVLACICTQFFAVEVELGHILAVNKDVVALCTFFNEESLFWVGWCCCQCTFVNIDCSVNVELEIWLLCEVLFAEAEVKVLSLQCKSDNLIDKVACEHHLDKSWCHTDTNNKCCDVACQFCIEERQCDVCSFFCFFAFCCFCFTFATLCFTAEESADKWADHFCRDFNCGHIKTAEVNEDAICNVNANKWTCFATCCNVDDDWCIDAFQKFCNINAVNVVNCVHNDFNHFNDIHIAINALDFAFDAQSAQVVEECAEFDFCWNDCLDLGDIFASLHFKSNFEAVLFCDAKEVVDDFWKVDCLVLCKCCWNVNCFREDNVFNFCKLSITAEIFCCKVICMFCCELDINILDRESEVNVCVVCAVIQLKLHVGVEDQSIIKFCINFCWCKDSICHIFVKVKTAGEHFNDATDELIADWDWELTLVKKNESICACFFDWCCAHGFFATIDFIFGVDIFIEQSADCFFNEFCNDRCCDAELGNVEIRCIEEELAFNVVSTNPEVVCTCFCNIEHLNDYFTICKVCKVNNQWEVHTEVCWWLACCCCGNFKCEATQIAENSCKYWANINCSFWNAKFKFNRRFDWNCCFVELCDRNFLWACDDVVRCQWLAQITDVDFKSANTKANCHLVEVEVEAEIASVTVQCNVKSFKCICKSAKAGHQCWDDKWKECLAEDNLWECVWIDEWKDCISFFIFRWSFCFATEESTKKFADFFVCKEIHCEFDEVGNLDVRCWHLIDACCVDIEVTIVEVDACHRNVVAFCVNNRSSVFICAKDLDCKFNCIKVAVCKECFQHCLCILSTCKECAEIKCTKVALDWNSCCDAVMECCLCLQFDEHFAKILFKESAKIDWQCFVAVKVDHDVHAHANNLCALINWAVFRIKNWHQKVNVWWDVLVVVLVLRCKDRFLFVGNVKCQACAHLESHACAWNCGEVHADWMLSTHILIVEFDKDTAFCFLEVECVKGDFCAGEESNHVCNQCWVDEDVNATKSKTCASDDNALDELVEISDDINTALFGHNFIICRLCFVVCCQCTKCINKINNVKLDHRSVEIAKVKIEVAVSNKDCDCCLVGFATIDDQFYCDFKCWQNCFKIKIKAFEAQVVQIKVCKDFCDAQLFKVNVALEADNNWLIDWIVEIHLKAESINKCIDKILDCAFFKSCKTFLNCTDADDAFNDTAKVNSLLHVQSIGILCILACCLVKWESFICAVLACCFCINKNVCCIHVEVHLKLCAELNEFVVSEIVESIFTVFATNVLVIFCAVVNKCTCERNILFIFDDENLVNWCVDWAISV